MVPVKGCDLARIVRRRQVHQMEELLQKIRFRTAMVLTHAEIWYHDSVPAWIRAHLASGFYFGEAPTQSGDESCTAPCRIVAQFGASSIILKGALRVELTERAKSARLDCGEPAQHASVIAATLKSSIFSI
jgi:hypothetical protein